MSKKNQIKQLKTKVPIDVQSAAHLILLDVVSSSLIKKIIKAPIRGKKIVAEIIGQSIILIENKPR